MSRTASAAASVFPGATPSDYRLKSDIAQYCLPETNRDDYRRLAYVNSICLVFLITGLIGVRRPDLITKEPEVARNSLDAEIFKPPMEVPPEVPRPDEPPPEEPPPLDSPVVAVAVAAPEDKVAFAVPVQIEGPVTFVPGKFAPPPPRELPKPAPAGPMRFRASKDGGFYPRPEYPALAQRRSLEGEVIIWIRVDASGQITEVELKKTSGHAMLDQVVLDVVRGRWRFPAGEDRFYEWSCTFQMPK